MSVHRCDSCGKTRANITVVVVDGELRDLCPACLPPLRPSEHADRQCDPKHRDPLLQFSPGPLRLVDASVRDVWTRPALDMLPRCQHEDGRGQCSSRVTTSRWNARERRVERFCARHADEFTVAS